MLESFVIDLSSKPVGMVQVDKNLMVATMNDSLSAYD
jgi:hypothetical protein